MVLEVYVSNGVERGHGVSGWLNILMTSIFLRGCYLQCTNFLSLGNKESVIVSTVIPVDASGKQGEIEVATVLTTQDSLAQLAHDTALIS